MTSSLGELTRQEGRTPVGQTDAFTQLQRAFDLLKQRKFAEAQAASRRYQELIDYDALPRTDNRVDAAPKISVVVVAYKIGSGLIRCLDSLATSENPPHEIIVVDNGGNEDIAAELARRPILHIRVGFNVILAEGRNIGVHFARAPIVSFVDDDAIAAEGYLASVMEAFETFDIHAFRGKVLPKSDHPNNGRALHYNMGDLPIPAEIDTEGNSAFRADTWRKFGGQDPLLFGGEGTELSYRMAKELGDSSVIYWPFAVIHHDYAVTDAKLAAKQSRDVLMREYAVFKHPDLSAFHGRLVAFVGSNETKAEGNRLLRRRAKTSSTEPAKNHCPLKPGARDPFVSICVPTYNRAQFIEETLESALAQTYPNFEVVVVDDGSTDNTVAVMARIRDPRVRFIVKEHSGGPATRNRCIAEARGEFLLWLDSDDALLPNTLEVYAAAMRQHPDVDVFYGNLLEADEHLAVQGRWDYRDYYGWRDTLLSDTIIENRIPNGAALVRKSCYDKVGGYNPAFRRAHDYEFWTRLVPVATMKSVHADTFIYRRHEESLSRLRQPADTCYEANAVKAMLARHELRALFPFCYAAGAPVHNGNARAWLIASLLMVKYGDLAAAVEFAKRSVDCADRGQNADICDILQMVANGSRSQPTAKTKPHDEFAKLVTVAKKQFAAGQIRECAKACAQLTKLRPEAVETLLLAGLSLRRGGNPQDAKTAFRYLVASQCGAAHLEAVMEAEALRRNQPETAADSATPAERLAALLSPFFGGERMPAQAIENTLSFIAAASATDARKHLETHREKQTPLFFAVLGLTADELGRCVDAAVADQITRLRAALQPPTPTIPQRPPGYSFCIITGGQRRAILERQIASIRALGLPHVEILVGGDVSNVPDGVHKVDMAAAARAARLGKMRNTLARIARFDHLVISDDDIVFDKNFGDGLKRFGEGYDAMAVRVVNPDGSRFWDWATTGGTKGSVLLDYWDADPYVYITGGICVLKADVLDRVAWDDLRGFYACEDVDFSTRLKAAGAAICFNTFCKVLHDDDRYSRVDRGVFRFDNLLEYVLQRHQSHEHDDARRYLAEAARMAGTYPDRIAVLKDVASRIREQNYSTQLVSQPAPQPAPSSAGEVSTPARGSGRVKINWVGSFLDHGSLSHVNRELTAALEANADFVLQRVSNNPATVNSAAIEWRTLARNVATNAPIDAAVTVRHEWPPDWRRPQRGALVVIQPWEYGALPVAWVEQSCHVNQFWVPSEYVREVYVRSGIPEAKVKVVPNGIDPERFYPGAQPLSLPTRKAFTFLFVGGTIHRKGPDVLLKAYLENFTAADDVCLVIKDFGGQSVYAGQTFEQQIRAAQLQPNAPEILYLNEELPPDSMPGLYTACDCLVHPYRGEGFGLPVLEAMACGLPVIVTAGGAADDFAVDGFAYRIPATKKSVGDSISGMKLTGTGWLLEPDAKALTARMKWVVEHRDDARAMGHRASEYARREWTWERAAQIAAERLAELPTRGVADTRAGGKRLERATAGIVLPPCALVGHLGQARELLRHKKPRDAWETTLSVLQMRPFHPEAYLLLAEIAQAAGDSASARLCAGHARHLAPGWKPARRFLNQRLKGKARPDWLTLPHSVTSQPSPVTNRLTVCLIAKNEEKFIGQCLASVRGLADQIVVVDTGSTDRTVEIAKEHGAEVHFFEWCDDFSAARNAALEHVRGDWVLALDADEELTAEGRESVREEMRANKEMAYRLPIVDVGHEAEGCGYVPRLFRNAPGLFYVGRIHEQVFSSVEVRCAEWGLENNLSKATLLHHGYTAETARERDKNGRNLRLLERAIEELPGEPNLLMNYGLELARAGRLDAALDQYRQAFQALEALPEDQVAPELRESLLTQFSAQLMAAKRFEEVVRMRDAPLVQRGGPTASLHFGLGLSYMQLRRFEEAAEQFRQCLAKRDRPALAPVNRDIHKAGPQHCLAKCLTEMKQFDAADREFQQAMAKDPQSKSVRFDYARFRHERGQSVDALKILHELAMEQPEALPVWLLGGHIALSDSQFLGFAREWTAEAIKQFPQDQLVALHRAEALLLSGRAGEALPLWRRAGAPQNPVHRAGRVLCELVVGERINAVSPDIEPAVSGEFIKWYQRLLGTGQTAVVEVVNGRLDSLAKTLPSAGKIVESAIAQVQAAAVC
ncbi:MAG: glycosyltransferase [Verrucomicrobiia bacterium]